jgi:hypothetical protein
MITVLWLFQAKPLQIDKPRIRMKGRPMNELATLEVFSDYV